MSASESTCVLVTGGAGFIGSHTVEALLARGSKVRVLDDFSSGRIDNLASVIERVDLIEGSVTNPALVARAIEGCASVVHLAARSSVAESFAARDVYHEVNVTGTSIVVDAAHRAGARRVVFASSCSVYGTQPAPQSEAMTPSPLSPYAAGKLEGERLLHDAAATGTLDAAALRFFNIYGARQDPNSAYAAVIPRFFTALRHGEAVTLYGDGAQTRDFTHVTDAARAILCALDAPTTLCGAPINIGTGVATSIRTLLALIAAQLHINAQQRHEPAREGEVRESFADQSRASELLGFRTETTLPQGLALMAFTSKVKG